MSLKNILLGLLDAPLSGYEVKKIFDDTLGHFWAAKLSQIYPTLHQMEKEKLLRSRVEHSSIGPDRKVYTRTKKGLDRLKNWLSSPPEMGDERFSYLSKLFFMNELDNLDFTLNFFIELRAKFQHRLNSLKKAENLIREEHPSYPKDLTDDLFYPYLTLRSGLVKLKANIRWCDECIRNIEDRLKKNTLKKSQRLIEETAIFWLFSDTLFPPIFFKCFFK